MNVDFYANHPSLQYAFFNRDLFSCFNSVISFSVSHLSLDSNLTGSQLIKTEAINMCCNQVWSSYFCVLALASVVKRKIRLHFPDFGDLKFKKLYDSIVFPRDLYGFGNFSTNSVTFDILFCDISTNQHSEKFSPNHFVPLVMRKNPFSITSVPTLKRHSSETSFRDNSDKKIKKVGHSIFFKKNMYDYFKSSDSCSVPTSTMTSTLTTPAIKTTSSTLTTFTSTFSHTISTSLTDNYSNFSPTVKSCVVASKSTSTTTNSLKTTNSLNLTSSISEIPSDNFINTIASNSSSDSVNDVSTYFEKSKTALIKNVYVPEKSFVFLKNNDKRKFRHDWLTKYSEWLRYSPNLDGRFCLPCSLFFHKAHKRYQRQLKLISKPVFASAESTSIFHRHESARDGIHSFCLHAYQTFLNNFTGKSLPIDTLVDNLSTEKIKKNKKFLRPIVDTVVLCGHLGLSLRGHRDDSQYHPQSGAYCETSGVGNFIELINFAIRHGDHILGEHYKTHAKNASLSFKIFSE